VQNLITAEGDFALWLGFRIRKIRQEEYYVKANNIESIQHTFLVENIKQEIEKYTDQIKIGLSRDPEINDFIESKIYLTKLKEIFNK